MKRDTFLRILIFTIATVGATAMSAQTRTYNRKPGTTEIVGDLAVQQLVDKHIAFNEQVKTIPGWRIQIAALSGSNSRAEAFKRKEQFKTAFPDIEAYVIFTEPNFKVVVGDFITRLDAYLFLQKCKDRFPGSIIKDEVYPIHLSLEELVPESDTESEH